MTKEEAKSLLLQGVLYRTIAWASILWIPASKLDDCSPNWDMKMAMASMFDFNAVIMSLFAALLFTFSSSSKRRALEQLNKENQD